MSREREEWEKGGGADNDLVAAAAAAAAAYTDDRTGPDAREGIFNGQFTHNPLYKL